MSISAVDDPRGLVNSETVKQLIGELVPVGGKVRIISLLSGSYKEDQERRIYKAVYITKKGAPGNWLFIKQGQSGSLKNEWNNYDQYVTKAGLRPEFTIRLREPLIQGEAAILSGEFIDLNAYLPFSEYYHSVGGDPSKAVDNLLNKVLQGWYGNTDVPQFVDFEDWFRQRTEKHVHAASSHAERLFPGLTSNSFCLIEDLGLKVLNPFPLLSAGALTIPNQDSFCTLSSVIHGDLNFDNIFIHKQDPERIRLIDFESTTEDCPLKDLAKLECEIKFQMLGHYQNHLFWSALIAAEEQILKDVGFGQFETSSDASIVENLEKALSLIHQVRTKVKLFMDHFSPNLGPSAYWTELLIRTLAYIGFRKLAGKNPEATDSARKYAIISALLLANNHFKER